MADRNKQTKKLKKLTTNAGAPVADNQNIMTAEERKALFENTARAMGDAPREIKVRHIGNCLKADPAYGKGVAKALRIPMSEVSENR